MWSSYIYKVKSDEMKVRKKKENSNGKMEWKQSKFGRRNFKKDEKSV